MLGLQYPKKDNQVLNFTFYDNNNIAQFSYDINLNFKGWRAATTSYV